MSLRDCVNELVMNLIHWSERFLALKGCIYLIKNTVKNVKYYCNVKQLFSVWIYIKLRDGSRFSNIRLVNLIMEYRLGYAIIF